MTRGKRTFESADRFWEVWRGEGGVLTRSGSKGTQGKTSRHPMRSVAEAGRFISDAVAEQVLHGFVEREARSEQARASRARRFTCETDGARKFWEVSLSGAVQTVRFGLLGSRGTSRQKTWESPAAASRATERLVTQKRARGYVEHGTPAPPPEAPAPDARHAGLEGAMFDAPNDPAPALVYADWLLARGNPWGELISTQHALEANPGDRRLRALEKKLLGALGLSSRLKVSWLRGRVDEVVVRGTREPGPTLTRAVEHLFSLPMCGGLRRLELSSHSELLLAVARGRPFARRLETLVVADGLVPEDSGAFPGLRRLGVASVREPHVAVNALRAWPALSELDLGFDAPTGRVLAALQPMLAGDLLPTLVVLAVRHGDELSAELAGLIPESPLAPRLRGLALSHLDLRGVHRLVAAARKLPALEWLDVSDRHWLVENDLRSLRAALPRVRVFTSEGDLRGA